MLIIYALGAKDPEMDEMEKILKEKELPYMYAKVDGIRVNPGNAYEANNKQEIPQNTDVVFVECSIAGIRPKKIVDHHRPNDPGYGKGPELFWEASSLGQLIAFLESEFSLKIEKTEDRKMLAAMDHCYPAAIQGKCPEISGKDVFRKKMDCILESTYEMLRNSDVVKIGNVEVFLLKQNTGIGYTASFLMAQTGAVSLGIPILIPCYDDKKGLEKVHLCGIVSKETVSTFMKKWAEENGWDKNIYGNPSRGYAGAYRDDPKKAIFCTWCEYEHFPPIHSEACRRIADKAAQESRRVHEERESHWQENENRKAHEEWLRTPLRDRR